MKIYVADQYGSHVLGVLKLDGTPGVKGTDYAEFIGDVVKNKPFNIRKGGVILKDGIVVTKDYSDIKRYIIVVNKVKNGELIATARLQKPLHELGDKPPKHPGFEEVWDQIMEVALLAYRKGRRKKIEQRWAINERNEEMFRADPPNDDEQEKEETEDNPEQNPDESAGEEEQ